MEPRDESNGSRPNSPQSDDSSSESELSSPSFNRDVNFETTKDVIEAEPSRETILDMAPPGTGYESDTSSIIAVKNSLPPSIDLTDNTDKKSRVLPKPVSSIHVKYFPVLNENMNNIFKLSIFVTHR